MHFSKIFVGAALAASASALPATVTPEDLLKEAPVGHTFKILEPAEWRAKFTKLAKNNNTIAVSSTIEESLQLSKLSARANCVNPKTRVEWRNMPDADRRTFVRAARCLMDGWSTGLFPGAVKRQEDLVWVHQQLVNQIHGYGHFLPWHRYFLNIYETLLRDECGYQGALPWWDETKDAGAFSRAPLFTNDYYGDAPLKRSSNDAGTCINNGAFGGVRLNVGPGASFTNHCLARAVDESLTYETRQGNIDICHWQGSYQNFANCLEGGPHAYGHNGIGAVMSDVAAAPSDPLFFLHHTFIDRTWWRWQNQDRANRLYAHGGYTDSNGTPMTLEYTLQMRRLKPDLTVYDMMDTNGQTLCYRYDY